MKTVRLILAVGLWMSVMAAQAGPIQLGVKAGLVSSKVSYSGTVEGFGDLGEIMKDHIRSRSGWAGGVFATLGLGPMLSLQPELLFVRKGWVWEETYPRIDEGGNVIGESTARDEFIADYLQVPIVARWTAPLAGPVKPSIFAGPAFSFKIGSDGRWWIDNQEILVGNLGVDEMADRITSTEVGAVLGVEVEIAHFLVEARYDLGLTDIIEAGADPDDVTTKSRSLILMGGYRF